MRVVPVLLAAVVLAGCGSTAHPPPVTAQPSATASAVPEPTSEPSTSADPAVSGSPGPGATATGSARPVVLPTGSPTTTPLALGVVTADRKVFEPLLAHWNERGGLGGRPVAPVWAAGCAQLGRVDLALLASGATPDGCAAVPTLSLDLALGDTESVTQAPGLTALVGLTLDDRVRLVLSRALSPSTGPLGVVVEACDPATRAVARTLTPLAKQRGFTVAATATVPCGKGADAGKAVDALEAKDVAQVVLVSAADEARVLRAFTKAARAKGFSPTYGVTSAAVPSTVTDQRDKVVGVGWVPSLDLTASTASAAANSCLRELRQAGVPRPATNAERFAAYRACDALRFANAVLTKGRGAWTRDAVRAQGRAFRASVLLEAATDVADRATAPAVARAFAWSAACRCVEYTGARFGI